jgi:uncharacterized membrane protein YadS
LWGVAIIHPLPDRQLTVTQIIELWRKNYPSSSLAMFAAFVMAIRIGRILGVDRRLAPLIAGLVINTVSGSK